MEKAIVRQFDIAIAGGGLAGSLIALALRERRPELTVALIERGDAVGGNHVWSFFASDVAAADRALVEPLVAARWDAGYSVRFPGFVRELPTPYRSVTSENLAAAIARALPADAVMTGRDIASLDADGATLTDGTRIAAHGVIDTRGLNPDLLRHFSGGWQKFVGTMLTTREPHGLDRPVVMDARVEQLDGYRFVYCLPFSATKVFVEDTYYSDTPDLDRVCLLARIDAYAAAQGWDVVDRTRTESGVLPVVTDGDFAAFWQAGHSDAAIGRAGVRAGLFQPLTSYSLPDAVRFAAHVAALPDMTGSTLARASRAWAERHWRRGRFYRLLARMLFAAAEPAQRYRVLQRFYALDEALIERFYAGRSTSADKLRVLAGKPPVPITKAVMALAGIGVPGALTEIGASPAPEGTR
ncbi:lycopene cyclase [Croceicoccus ponticola]|uniref:Lycopene cyclase n=1 Tax=Croceicoccus ponticola TaxID=2217664 RepID=A0A437GZA7_9SPHN|nr:lycopene beta-cyclase CrtY [Croceicoccus ponticola]RVQ68691.1 lycopene cyclase [Croceicoccus ponticola]